MMRTRLVFWAVVACLARMSELRCTAGECPNGWVKFRDHSCVKLFMEIKKSWPEAEAICRQVGRGSFLVKILDDADHTALADLLAPHIAIYMYAWIGLNDIMKEGDWVWVGEPQVGLGNNFHKFRPGEPNNSGGEDCVGSKNYGWNDFQCAIKLNFVCQKPLYNTV